MRVTYRVLAYLLAAEVMVQAAAIAYAIFGLSKHIDDGAVVDKASQESGATFDGVLGFVVHGINGEMVIPLLALILLVVSFFAKVPGGVMFASVILALIVVQILLGIFSHELPGLGVLHGANALAIFIMAFLAGQRARAASTPVAAMAVEESRA
jgi:hypothetical protein